VHTAQERNAVAKTSSKKGDRKPHGNTRYVLRRKPFTELFMKVCDEFCSK
jgi:hypothetical protein